MKKLDKLIHQPTRTKIIAHLVNVGECDFNSLKNALTLTDGHISTHMRELISHQYVEARKRFIKNKPNTLYRITEKGKQQFLEYVGVLKSLIAL